MNLLQRCSAPLFHVLSVLSVVLSGLTKLNKIKINTKEHEFLIEVFSSSLSFAGCLECLVVPFRCPPCC